MGRARPRTVLGKCSWSGFCPRMVHRGDAGLLVRMLGADEGVFRPVVLLLSGVVSGIGRRDPAHDGQAHWAGAGVGGDFSYGGRLDRAANVGICALYARDIRGQGAWDRQCAGRGGARSQRPDRADAAVRGDILCAACERLSDRYAARRAHVGLSARIRPGACGGGGYAPSAGPCCGRWSGRRCRTACR